MVSSHVLSHQESILLYLSNISRENPGSSFGIGVSPLTADSFNLICGLQEEGLVEIVDKGHNLYNVHLSRKGEVYFDALSEEGRFAYH